MPTSMAPAPGRLLVAAPVLSDPNFAKAVVLLLDHDESGTLGVVVNRPTQLRVHDVLSPWSTLVSGPDVVFEGGPVGPRNALGLAALTDTACGRVEVAAPALGEAEPLGWRKVFGTTGLVDLDTPPEVVAAEVGALRIFAGYAGWSPGQLDDELAQGAWYVVASEPADAFGAHPERLWAEVLRRQGGDMALQVTRPADPGLN